MTGLPISATFHISASLLIASCGFGLPGVGCPYPGPYAVPLRPSDVSVTKVDVQVLKAQPTSGDEACRIDIGNF